MGETTIEWTATYNADGTSTPGYSWTAWWGCTKVSPGCVNCYAEAFVRRFGRAEWGPTAQRVRTSAANWRKPLLWNEKVKKEGRRAKVFGNPMSDAFEKNNQLTDWRRDLWELIDRTPYLDWLLLTKRPENFLEMLPVTWLEPGKFPANLWLGTSVENQEAADKRIPLLLRVPAAVRFLSCEPLLGPLDLAKWLAGCPDVRGVDWIIAGGESGPQARPVHEDWARSLRDQCVAAKIPYFWKQWGQYAPVDQTEHEMYNSGELMLAADKQTEGRFIRFVSKQAAGRLLDGRYWNEMPR